MGDVDDAHAVPAFSPRMTSNRVSTSRSSSDEVGSSMITSCGIEGDRAGDGDHLLQGDVEVHQRLPDIEVNAEPRQDVACLAVHRGASR